MGGNKILKKLEKVNSEKEEVIFKMEYKGKIIHKKIIELPGYANDIIDDEEMSFFYFFKDMANRLEDKINEIHKKKIWNQLGNENKDDTNKNAK